MKLQVACMILVLVIFSVKNCCSFQGQPEDPAGLLTQQMEPEEETQGLQALLRRPKRHNTHFPICSFCCKCCQNTGCGFCCRT